MAAKGQVKDLTGKRFGMLIVQSLVGIFKHTSYWLCRCDCGNMKTVRRGHLISGDTSSCGCYRDKSSSDRIKRWRHKQIGPNHPNWIGGRYKSKEGYIYCIAKDHPYAVDNGYVLEHRLVMERHLGRYLLPTEIVHHIDRKKDNNSLGNLILFASHAEHMLHHIHERKANNLCKTPTMPGCEVYEQ